MFTVDENVKINNIIQNEKIAETIVFLKDNKETLLEGVQSEKIVKAIKMLDKEITRWETKLK
jgi:hypothetical protein